MDPVAIRRMSSVDLITMISSRGSIEYDLEFARRVAERMEQESVFFFGKYSIPFLNEIAIGIAHANNYRDVLGFYYDFVSAPLVKQADDSVIPQFNLLRKYRGKDGAHLYSYVMTSTRREAIRHYNRQRPGALVLGGAEPFDFERVFMHSDESEIGWAVLNAFFYGDEVESEQEYAVRIKKIKKAFSWLQEKDKLILQYLVFDEKSGLDAFELLKRYVRPKGKDNSIENWDDIKKQNTMSLWKTRALKHLEQIAKNPQLKI